MEEQEKICCSDPMLKVFKFNLNDAYNHDLVSKTVNDWANEAGVSIKEISSSYKLGAYLFLPVTYREYKKKVTLSDFIEKNSGIYSVLGVLVAVITFLSPISNTKAATYLSALFIGLVLCILVDFFANRYVDAFNDNIELTIPAVLFNVNITTLTLGLILYWLTAYRAYIRAMDGFWAIIILGIFTKPLIDRYINDLKQWIKNPVALYFILCLIFLLFLLPLSSVISRALDIFANWASTANIS